MVQNKFALWHIQYVCAVLTILVNNVFEITENICVITLVSFIISDHFHHTRHCTSCSYVLNTAWYFYPLLRVILLSYNL